MHSPPDSPELTLLKEAHHASGDLLKGREPNPDEAESLNLIMKALVQPREDVLLKAVRSTDPAVAKRAKKVLREFADLLATENGTRLSKASRSRQRKLSGKFFS